MFVGDCAWIEGGRDGVAHQVIYEETVGHDAGKTEVYQQNSLVRGC